MTPDEKRQFEQLQRDFDALLDEFYRNNFPTRQDFNKAVTFNGRTKITHYASLPTVAETGELAESAGILYIASATNTWTKVGTQT